MSKKNIENFYETLANNTMLQNEFAECLKNKTSEPIEEIIIEFASKNKFIFSKAELIEFEAETQELSKEDLDKINAAGIYVPLSMRLKYNDILHKHFSNDKIIAEETTMQ